MKRIISLVVLLLVSFGFANDYNLGVNFGSKGIGVDSGMMVSKTFVGRFAFDFSSFYSASGETDSDEPIAYDADFSQLSFGALADWHPFENGFRLSLGVYFLDYNVEATGKAAKNYEIGTGLGQITYTPDDLGEIDVDGETNSLAPYFGIGYNNSFYGDGNWFFNFELGAIYSGSPEFSVNSTGMIRHTETDLEPLLNDDLEEFQLFPKLQLGVTYKF